MGSINEEIKAENNKEIKLMNPRGTKDYIGKEQQIRKNIRNTLTEVFEVYGYEELETPILNYTEVLASKYAGGSEILKEMYGLTDQGKRDLALRYDLTIPNAKVVGMTKQLGMPFKRYEIGRVFRDGPVKTGRLREFTQCDVDIVGIKSQIAEAEILAMAIEALNRLDLDITISINNRKILNGLLTLLEVEKERQNDVILTLDKIEKIELKEIEKELKEYGINKEIIEKLLELIANPKELDKILVEKSNETMKEGLKELKELNKYLYGLNLTEKFRFNPFLARGLDIYTGTVYEIFLNNSNIKSSIAAGGRYDNIITKYIKDGKEYPAVGISFGLDVIYQALIEESINVKTETELYLIPLGTELEALKIITELRKKGIKSEMEMKSIRLKKSLDYANKKGIKYVIILGENELDRGEIKIKNMEESTEETISINKLIEEPRKYLE